MYQSSSSSSSQKSLAPGGLVRYGSAPGSLLTTALDSVSRSSPTTINLNSTLVGHYYSGDSSSRLKSESTCTKVFSSNGPQDPEAASLQTYGGSTSLLSQQRSPAGFFSQLTADNGISEGNEELVINGGRSYHQNSVAAATGFGMESSWGNSNCISFASPESRQAAKTPGGDAFTCLNGLGTEFNLSSATHEMAAMDTQLLHISEDSVPSKIRARRGFATHPRSIAERERRTRISGKLKKLQELVPNMDKQTSYADMLDLAVNHIKGLQQQVQKLEKELGNCTCGSKQR